MTKTKIRFVVEMKAPNMMLSWNGSLYIRKNKTPKYLQKNYWKMSKKTQRGHEAIL
jgi:hypothetical protein